MPSFSFKEQFVKDVENGKKTQTIRAKRKNRPRIGQVAYLFIGLRTSNCKRLGEHEIVAVDDVFIDSSGIKINGFLLDPAEEHALAVSDGFNNASELLDFFKETHDLPFSGDLIKWS